MTKGKGGEAKDGLHQGSKTREDIDREKLDRLEQQGKRSSIS